MANILKIIRGILKTIAIIISIAFLINSFNGILGALELMNGENVQMGSIDSGDFKINYNNLYIEVQLDITNPGIYDMDGIIVSMLFQMKANLTNAEWETILNTTSVILDDTIDPSGDVILPGESKPIGLTATIPDFSKNMTEIAILFGLNESSWDLADLMDVDFESKLTLGFSIDYAFKQYQLDFTLFIEGDEIKRGL